MIKNKLF